MRVLHIASFYTGSALYKNLCIELDKMGVQQTIYTPVKSESLIGKHNIVFSQNGSRIIYSNILNFYNRVVYWSRISAIFNDIEDEIDIKKFDIIHAHSWYVDGGVAQLLSKKYKIPYITAVRNTDLNQYLKFMPWLHQRGKQILSEAQAVVFISEAYKKRLISHASFHGKSDFFDTKAVVLPNGIDNYWIENAAQTMVRHENERTHKLLFVGSITKQKNLIRTMQAVVKLNLQQVKCHLNIIGGDGGYGLLDRLTGNISVKKQVEQIAVSHPDYFTLIGRVDGKEFLRDIYLDSNIFIMPSLRETFGLVYIEALSQGVPVVYSKGEGIDGMFAERIGEVVNPFSVDEIANAVRTILSNYHHYNFSVADTIKQFNWSIIANQYNKIYQSIFSNRKG